MSLEFLLFIGGLYKQATLIFKNKINKIKAKNYGPKQAQGESAKWARLQHDLDQGIKKQTGDLQSTRGLHNENTLHAYRNKSLPRIQRTQHKELDPHVLTK